MLWPSADDDFEPWSSLAPTLTPLLERQVGRLFMPWTIANAAALSACNTADCKIVIEIGPGLCGALATAPNPTGWGTSSRGTRGDAELGAMEVCQHYNVGQCKVQASDCNQ